jgi:hypothetical protein
MREESQSFKYEQQKAIRILMEPIEFIDLSWKPRLPRAGEEPY